MKTVGIIGGIGPESTIEYYRQIITSYRKHEGDGNYPQIIINSINMKKMLDLIGNRSFDEVANYLAAEIRKLADAGADFGVMASNTPHIVFEKVRRVSSLPLISIVEATCDKARDIGLRRLGLFGTKFTMQGGFYNEVLSQYDIETITPEEPDQHYIHNKYMEELIKGVIHTDTRNGLLEIVDKIKQSHDVQGLILGGTELPLILEKEDVSDIHLLDTTEIHVESILKRLHELDPEL